MDDNLQLYYSFKTIKFINNDIKKTFDEKVSTIKDFMVELNKLGIFGKNEEFKELSLLNLCLLNTPFYIAELYYNKPYHKDTRIEDITNAKIYFGNFLALCIDYKIASEETSKIIQLLYNKDEKLNTIKDRKFNVDQIKETNLLRKKIENFELHFRQPAIEAKILDDDQETLEYVVSFSKLHMIEAVSAVNIINREISLLYSHKNKDEQPKTEKPQENKAPSITILKIATKNQVFGYGYPSLPSMSIEQFIEREIKEGRVDLNKKPAKSNSDSVEISEEEEDFNLYQKRDFDEYKDMHTRGAGNRKNKG